MTIKHRHELVDAWLDVAANALRRAHGIASSDRHNDSKRLLQLTHAVEELEARRAERLNPETQPETAP